MSRAAVHPASAHYDLIAIGSGPAGQRAAIQAARLGKRAAIIERQPVLGGASTNSSTLPSKTLRAAVMGATGAQGVSRRPYRGDGVVTMDDLLWRADQVIEHEREAIVDRLRRNRVDVLTGSAAFVDAHTVAIHSARGGSRVSADRIVIAVGTTPARPPDVDFDGETVLDSDGILGLRTIPRTLTIVGGGVVGLEYASMAAALGTRVTVVDRRACVLDFVDEEIVEGLQYHLRGLGVVFRLGEEARAVVRTPGHGAVTHLESGMRIPSEVVLHAAGREGATRDLNLAAAGLRADRRGRIPVDDDYRTEQWHIFAAGDVTGGPDLAASSMEQGRLAALSALGEPAPATPALLPYAVYTIPEISFVGRDERALADAAIPFVRGIARYRELVRGKIAGDRTGFLKLLVHADTRRLLGVHILGTSAAELVHIGQTAMATDLSLDYLVDAVFNIPTFADAYGVAALDAAGRLGDTIVEPVVAAAQAM